jgi:predicted Zn-dependent protease
MRPRCSSAPALVLVLAAGLACATLTPQEEGRLGAQLHDQLRRESQLLDDRVVQDYVADLGRRIAAAGGQGELDYRFYVLVDDDINAFAAPGGYVYVNTGTILEARNVAELAGVLGHEIGHVARHHLARNLGRRRTANAARQIGVVAAAIAAGPAGASAASLLGGLASLAALNSFGRGAEREADAFAVEVLPEAGYDPEGLLSFFQTLLRRRNETASGSFLSDHPATEERIAETRRMIDAASPPAGLRGDDGGRLEIIQRRIRILTGAASPEAFR